MAKKKKTTKSPEASPAKSLGAELKTVQRDLRATIRAYETRLNDHLIAMIAWADDVQKIAQPSREQLRDLGDMLGLLRKLKLKPEKGRRRDLRKIDEVVDDLVILSRQKRISADDTARGK